MVAMGNANFDSTQPFGATPALREALQDLGQTKTGASGSFLFQVGEKPSGVFLLLEGKVTLTLAENGVRYSRTVGPGSVLGLPSSMCLKPYSLSARIVEPVRYVFVTCAVVKEFLRTRPDLCFQVVEILAREVREMRHATEEVVVAAGVH
jgi:CRP-like cAMP-binding protein